MKKIIISFIIIFLFSCSKDQGSIEPTLNGSYATLIVVNDYLYAINNEELTTFNISDPNNPFEVDKQNVGFEIENIYHNSGVLFLGSQLALHIFTIGNNGVPKDKSETKYFNSDDITPCDPVISSGNIAYVTLSTSQFVRLNRCISRRINVNELRIFDISNIERPLLLSKTQLDIPKGLALDGNTLFVCEENTGVKVLNVENPRSPKVIASLQDFNSYDVIARKGLLMVVNTEEIIQFDYSDLNNITYLSTINL